MSRADRGPWTPLFGLAGAGLALGERLGLVPGELDPDALLEEARRRTGLDDFGPPDFLEPYRVLLESYREEARLTPLGRAATRTDTLRLLTNRLRVVDDRKRHPGIGETPVRAPWIITGLPRTGTTLLFNLLALDPENRVPRTWEVMFPSPPPGAAPPGDGERRRRACDRRLRWFGRMAPAYRRIHPLGAELPQECIAITSHAFRSVRFHRTHHVPAYRAWLERADAAPAYRWHRGFLQQLAWKGPEGRWVLKTPAHLFTLEALLEAYPDATLVQTHREPLRALASNASQAVVLRRAFSRRVGTPRIDETLERWAAALERAMALRERDPARTMVDLRHAELVRDPVAGVRALYAATGRDLAPEAERRMRDHVRAHPREEHGAHRYTLEAFGIDPERHGDLFRRYRERFGV